MHLQFTDRVASVVKLASNIAREYGLEYVGTEHILLAIRQEGGSLGAKLLDKRGIAFEKLKAEIDRLVQKSMEDTWVFGRLPGTPHFRNVIATALDEAKSMQADKLRTEHLILALLKEQGSVACRALRNLGCDYDAIRADVAAQSTERTATERTASEQTGTEQTASGEPAET